MQLFFHRLKSHGRLLALFGFLVVGTVRGEDPVAHAIRDAKPGDVVSLPQLWRQQSSLPEIPIRIVPEKSAQFLFSDKPEYFPSDGISLREQVKPGVVRLYLYHVPEPSAGGKTITAVIENNSPTPMKMRFLRYAFPKPSRNYLQVGKRGLVEFFASAPQKTARMIQPGERMAIDAQMDKAIANKDELVHGFYEFEIDQPATVYVLQRGPAESSAEAIGSLPLLKTTGQKISGAGRGLFLTNDFRVNSIRPIETTTGPVKLIIADGKRDPWIHGMDSIDGPSRNEGNYGTLYRIRLDWRSADGRGLAVFAANRSADGFCAGQAMALKISAGEFPGGIVQIPREQSGYNGAGNLVLVQKFPASEKNKLDQIDIVYSPPGASCLPTPLIFVPYETAAK